MAGKENRLLALPALTDSSVEQILKEKGEYYRAKLAMTPGIHKDSIKKAMENRIVKIVYTRSGDYIDARKGW